MDRKEDVTIADVAAAAGVSVSTVSRILNDKPDVSQRTREHVANVIQSLGYAPHSQARGLAAGQSRAIALLYPVERPSEQPIDQLHLDFMVGASAAAADANYFFNVLSKPITEENLLALYRSVQVDGVILMEIFQEDWRVALLESNHYPFVMIGQCMENAGLNFIELDFKASSQLLVEHLVELGHTRIAYIGFPEHLRQEGYGPAVRGWNGYHQAVDKHGLQPITCETAYDAPSLRKTTQQLLEQNRDLTAIIALTDAPISGVFEVLRQKGLRVPVDFSVVGLGIDRISDILTPRLTAVRFPSYEMGFRAAAMLIEILEGKHERGDQVVIPPKLILRDSSAVLGKELPALPG